ncbi:hypothetical protein [Streptomyces sp. NPDC000133]|uniref:hypothetical protein n=1 Tax=Streptomyces sp. NPDC000133 TaxID=3364535 RepID=UPI00369F0B0A
MPGGTQVARAREVASVPGTALRYACPVRQFGQPWVFRVTGAMRSCARVGCATRSRSGYSALMTGSQNTSRTKLRFFIDLYDEDEYVTPAVAELTEFFGKHLAGQPPWP